MYLHRHIFICMYLHEKTFVSYSYEFVSIQIHPCVFIQIHLCVSIQIHPCVSIEIHPCVSIQIHPCVFIQIHPCVFNDMCKYGVTCVLSYRYMRMRRDMRLAVSTDAYCFQRHLGLSVLHT